MRGIILVGYSRADRLIKPMIQFTHILLDIEEMIGLHLVRALHEHKNAKGAGHSG